MVRTTMPIFNVLCMSHECSIPNVIQNVFQFRIGILPLHIETGRFRNVKINERKCYVCNNEYMENEFHFLFVCNAYIEFWNVLYNDI